MVYGVGDESLELYRFTHLPVVRLCERNQSLFSRNQCFDTIDECRDYIRTWSDNKIKELQDEIAYLSTLADLPYEIDKN